MDGASDVDSKEVSAMTVSHGKPYAGKPHVRFDEGAGVPGKGRSALLHEYECGVGQ